MARPSLLNDDLPMAEWVRLRNLQAGAGGDVISGEAGRDRLAGGAGQDRLAAQPSRPSKNVAARPAAPIDPSKTPVFRTGADGKLHPIPGWHTTGPFDFGTWAGNIDWGGVVRDLGKIAAGSITGAGLPGLASRMGTAGVAGRGLTRMDRFTLGAGVYAAGDAALDDVAPKKPPAHR